MKITLKDATLSLSATDAGERANIGALYQVLSKHQGVFSVTLGERTFLLNQKAEDAAPTDAEAVDALKDEGVPFVDTLPVGDEKPAFTLPTDTEVSPEQAHVNDLLSAHEAGIARELSAMAKP